MQTNSYGISYRRYIAVLALIFTVCTQAAEAQFSSDALVDMLRSRMGEQCTFRNAEGGMYAIESVGEMMIKAAMSGKRLRFKPWNVVDGVKYEMLVLDPVQAMSGTNTDDIDFAAPNLVFIKEDGAKIGAAEAKGVLAANANLIADGYNAKNGVVSEYKIIPKPKPQAVKMSVKTGETEALKSDDPLLAQALKKEGGAMRMEATKNIMLTTSILKQDTQMPDFDVKDINGKQWKMSELRDKVLVLNFWFVECPPCVDEMPALNALQKQYAANPDVVFLSFSNSAKSKIEKFLQTKPFSYPHIAQEQSEKLLEAWSVQMFPTNVVVHKGKIISSFTGGMAFKSEDDSASKHPMYALINKQIENCLRK